MTYDTGGSPESVVDHGGIVVERGNIEEIANVIRKLQDDKPERIVADPNEFDKSTCFEKYVSIITEETS